MNNKISNKLSARLTHLPPDQLDQLIGRAQMLKRRSNSTDSLDVWIERTIKKDEQALARCDKTISGTIVSVTSQRAIAETETGLIPVTQRGQAVVVGDKVEIALLQDGDASVLSIEPRRTKLSRPNVDQATLEQVIVANVDAVVIVVSVVSPPLHPRLIDRYLVAIQQGGAEPAIFVNKMDLLEDQAELNVIDPYRRIGVPTVFGSARSAGGGDELIYVIRGKTCAFVGHSGVGKSSIVNCLKPEAALETREVGRGYGRGTHTTTSSSLHRLADGTVLIDTPGIRSFGLRALESVEVSSYFPEFEAHQCRFRDCSHVHEPGCGVIAAVESGEIEEARYDAYLRLKDEIA